eukprot:1634358-Lingulodinium_polyedra.AAC.1
MPIGQNPGNGLRRAAPSCKVGAAGRAPASRGIHCAAASRCSRARSSHLSCSNCACVGRGGQYLRPWPTQAQLEQL